MEKFEATYTEITNWQKNVHYSTGGTRSKYIALHPDTNHEYFFKGSKEMPNGEIRYPTEFWSEIVSSKIGQFLGFEILDYNIAFDKNHKQKIGCISKSMILHSENKLTEGVYYLRGYKSRYNPERDKKEYTFQFIKSALVYFELDKYVENIIELIVFDSIIGNSDRHQENWGIIAYYKELYNKVNEHIEINNIKLIDKFSNIFMKLLMNILKLKNEETHSVKKTDLLSVSKFIPHQFAPIYDSGCCLGREREDIWIEKAINNPQILSSYVNKGESEIHWEGTNKKLNHFKLVELLLANYPVETKKYIEKVMKAYNNEKIKEIIEKIDYNLPNELIYLKLSDSRKILMYKLITLRIETLLKLI